MSQEAKKNTYHKYTHFHTISEGEYFHKIIIFNELWYNWGTNFEYTQIGEEAVYSKEEKETYRCIEKHRFCLLDCLFIAKREYIEIRCIEVERDHKWYNEVSSHTKCRTKSILYSITSKITNRDNSNVCLCKPKKYKTKCSINKLIFCLNTTIFIVP